MKPSILTPEMAQDVSQFIESFESKHKYPINVEIGGIQSSIAVADNPERLNQTDIVSLITNAMHSFDEDLKQYKSLRNLKTRKRDVLIWAQLYSYLAWRYGYNKSCIARFLNKNHATIIHSIKTIENYKDTKDVEYVAIYEHLKKYIQEYVGTNAGNPDRQTYSESALVTLCN